MTTTTIPADAVVELLTSEGYVRADVLAAIDSLVEAGVESDQNALTDADVQVCRDQLDGDAWGPRVAVVEQVAQALGVPVRVIFAAADEYRSTVARMTTTQTIPAREIAVGDSIVLPADTGGHYAEPAPGTQVTVTEALGTLDGYTHLTVTWTVRTPMGAGVDPYVEHCVDGVWMPEHTQVERGRQAQR